MNSTQKKFGLMAAMYMMAATGNEMPQIELPEKTPYCEWKRKKCKSCLLFPCSDNRHKYRSNPLSVACEKYTKRKN